MNHPKGGEGVSDYVTDVLGKAYLHTPLKTAIYGSAAALSQQWLT